MKVGVLALQGDVSEHVKMLMDAGSEINKDVNVIELKNFDKFDCDALVLPGGESTAMRRLLHSENNKFLNFLQKIYNEGIPIMGTCAGVILLAKNVDGIEYAGILDIEVIRNGYGRQKDSFEADIEINLPNEQKKKFHALFIRAPIIKKVNKGEILAKFEGNPVMVKDNNVIGLTFHPELTEDTTIYKYFLNLV